MTKPDPQVCDICGFEDDMWIWGGDSADYDYIQEWVWDCCFIVPPEGINYICCTGMSCYRKAFEDAQ